METGIEHKFFWNVLKHFLVTVKFFFLGGGGDGDRSLACLDIMQDIWCLSQIVHIYF